MGFVEGTQRKQINMISLEDMVGEKATVRIIDKFIETCNLEQMNFTHIKAAKTGRPGYNGKELAKLYVYGYENGIRSSRKLEKEAKRNVELMWLLEGKEPSHQTISEFRKENIRALQKLFYQFTKLCKQWGLIEGKLIAIDGTKIKASNNKKTNYSRTKVTERLKQIEEKANNYLESLEKNDNKENREANQDQKNIDQKKLEELTKRKEKYKNYLEEMDKTKTNEISETDKDARLMGNNRNGVEVAYNIQSAVDEKTHIIIEYDVITNPTDYGQLSNMTKKIKKRYKLKKFTVIADKGYYQGKDLYKCKKLKIKTIVSKQKTSEKKELQEEYKNKNFKYNQEKDSYTCPMKQELNSKKRKGEERNAYYNIKACKNCENKNQCVTNKQGYRTISRSIYAKEMEETDKRTTENMETYKKRQQLVEHPFGTIKRHMNGGYFLLRTRRKVRAEVAMLFLGYNLKRAINKMGFDKIMEKLEAIILVILHIQKYISEIMKNLLKKQKQKNAISNMAI